MKYPVCLTLASCLLAACGSDNIVVPESSTPSDSLVVNADINQPQPLDIGDVEATLHIEMQIDDADLLERSQVEVLRTAMKRLTAVTVDMTGAPPTSLPIKIRLKSKNDFTHSPVVFRGNLIREIEVGNRETIASFNTVVDIIDNAQVPTVAIDRFPIEFKADALAGDVAMPPTMVLYVQAEVILTEIGTPKESIDPATATGTPDTTSQLLSNTLRINFTPTESPESHESTPAAANGDGETTDGSTPAPNEPNGGADIDPAEAEVDVDSEQSETPAADAPDAAVEPAESDSPAPDAQ